MNNWAFYKNLFVCFFVCLFGVYRPTRGFFTHRETSPLLAKGCKFWPICSALMAIEQWGFFCVPHLLWHGASVIIVISENPWHSHLLPSVWQWSCPYLFLRLRSVAVGIRTPNIPLAVPTLKPTAPPPRSFISKIMNDIVARSFSGYLNFFYQMMP